MDRNQNPSDQAIAVYTQALLKLSRREGRQDPPNYFGMLCS